MNYLYLLAANVLLFTIFIAGCRRRTEEVLSIPSRAHPVSFKHEAKLATTIISGWDAISPTYLEHKATHLHPGDLIEAPVFQELIQKYSPQAQIVLDAGTGNGWFATSLLQWNILPLLQKIVAIDASPAMIKTARSQSSDPRVQFYRADLATVNYQCLNLEADSIDLIISSNAIDCMHNIDQVLHNLHTLLKPGGYAIISLRHPQRNAYYVTGNKDGLFKEGVYAEEWKGTGGNKVIRFYRTEDTWDKLFNQAGFVVIEKIIPIIAESMRYTHPEEYLHYKNKPHPGALIYVLQKT